MYLQITNKLKVALPLIILLFTSANTQANKVDDDRLTLAMAVKLAQQHDPWLVGNKHRQDAIESLSIAAETLPDPRMSLGVANIAADSFDFNQEAMTQFKIGLSQMFPRGDSLAIKKKQLQLKSSQFPFQRQDRKARVEVIVSNLWLDAYKAQQSIALIEKDRALFEQLADVAQASYSSAVGKTRQQDIVRAQLELTRLDDRLTQLKQKQQMAQRQLSQWLSQSPDANQPNQLLNQMNYTHIATQLPDTAMRQQQLFTSQKDISQQTLLGYFSNHPAVQSLEQKIKTSNSEVELAKQKYKPEWGVNAGYGIRNNAPTGMDRADLFSIGVSFDIPLFTTNRQDKQVDSAISKASAVKTEKWLLIKNLIASFQSFKAQLQGLNQRQALYQQRLLPQMHDQAEASLTAYTNDDGDFSEVVRSRIAELNATIDALNINVERQKTIIQLNYFFINNPPQAIAYQSSQHQLEGEK